MCTAQKSAPKSKEHLATIYRSERRKNMDNFNNTQNPNEGGENGGFNTTPSQNSASSQGNGFNASPSPSTDSQGNKNFGTQPGSGSFNGFSGNAHNAQGGYTQYSTSPTGEQGQRPQNQQYRQQQNQQQYQQRRPYDASGMNQNTFGSQQQYSYGGQSAPSAPQKKQKKNMGKTVFAVIICLCIVIASVGVGSALFSNNDVNYDSDNSQNNNVTSSAATPGVEQSPVSSSEYSGSGSMTAEQVYETVKDINVGVVVYSNNQKAGEGSGIVVGADDTNTYTYIITAAHVISSDYSVIVKFNDETEVDATIIGYDTKTDVGVLKVKKTGYKGATFGDSSKLAVGQTVYAIGNPGGSQFFGTFTDGKVTAIDRPVTTSSTSAYDLPCIQHNAAINPGNSGGALVNEYGQVIGLNSSKIADTSYEGMGFSVPINTVLSIYNDIVSHGYVTNRPMLGITYYAVSSDYTYSAIAWKNNLPYGSVVIKTINQNSDLANKNVQPGDIITAVNGTKLDTTDVLLEAIEKSSVGDTLTLSICRLNNNGSVNSTYDVKVSLVEDKGDNTVENTTESETNDFNNYFPFGN